MRDAGAHPDSGAHTAFNTERVRRLEARRLDGFGGSEYTWLVLVQGKEVVACLCVSQIRPPQITEDVVEISDVIVDSGHRGKGFGRQLLESAFAWGRERGLDGAMLNVMEFNTPARRLYEKMGMYTTGRTMSADL